MADLAGRDRQRHLHPPQRAPRRDRAAHRLDRARPLHRRRADPRAEAGQGRTAPASWRRSCRPACARSRPKSRRKPAPAASSCPTTASTCILSRRDKKPRPEQPASEIVTSETILTNMRVLAIDQTPKEKDGQNVVVGKTATLELEARAGRDARAAPPERHAVAGAAQPRRRQAERDHADDDRSRSATGVIDRSLRRITTATTAKCTMRTVDMKCRANLATMRTHWSAPCRFRPPSRSRSTRR